MRVSLMGQAAFGEAVFKKLLEDNVDVVGVSAPAPVGERKDPLWAAAEAAGLPVIDTPSLKEPAGQGPWRALNADLSVMAFVTEIIPNDVLKYLLLMEIVIFMWEVLRWMKLVEHPKGYLA